MMRAIEGGGMREYFAPESGRGLGARDFGWTAALCLRELGSGAGGLALAAGPASAVRASMRSPGDRPT